MYTYTFTAFIIYVVQSCKSVNCIEKLFETHTKVCIFNCTIWTQHGDMPIHYGMCFWCHT